MSAFRPCRTYRMNRNIASLHIRRGLISFWGLACLTSCLIVGAQQASDLQSATSMLMQRRYTEAAAYLAKIMPAHEEDAEAHVMFAYALFREDKPADSLREYTRAAQLRKPSAEDLKWVALDYVLLKDYQDAGKWMSVSLAMNPNDEEAWYGMGRIAYTQNNFKRAKVSFEEALKLHPEDVLAEDNLGLTYEALYKLDDAIAAYRKAIEWQQSSMHPSEQPYLNLAIVLLNQNKVDEASALLEKASTIAPDDPSILTEIARISMKQNRLADAERELRQALRSKPNDGALHFQLGRVLQKENKLEEAKAEFAKTAALDGTHSSPDR
jgi:Tfp pilus assembly protein PilF